MAKASREFGQVEIRNAIAAGELREVDVTGTQSHPRNFRRDGGSLQVAINVLRGKMVAFGGFDKSYPVLMLSDGTILRGNCRAAAYRELVTGEPDKYPATIPAIVLPVDTPDGLQVAILADHGDAGDRTELTGPEMLEAVRTLRKSGATEEAIAATMGRSRSGVQNYTRILSLPAKYQDAFADALAGVKSDNKIRLADTATLAAMHRKRELSPEVIAEFVAGTHPDCVYAKSRKSSTKTGESVSVRWSSVQDQLRLCKNRKLADLADTEGVTVDNFIDHIERIIAG